MKLAFPLLVLASTLIASTASVAQAPAGAPTGSTGLCKDGTYTSNAEKKGACKGHKGVKDWFIATGAAAATVTAVPAASAAVAAKPAPAAPPKTAVATAAAPGGGAGQVWVNKDSKVYHCPGTKYYGKTKQGEYMSESAAKAAGNHADHGKACS